ncbi:MAG TPA: YbhB/YbcL family Raf kinase inhibitor-like protein [Bacteroidales bacterium]|nr:YbhB/YbcL family Raf kinase inhibitor-like protein [Bacteroidales bacterium]
MAFNLTSRSFEYGTGIPAIFTCDGDNISPALRWDEAPKNTVTFALILEDPDAPGGTYTHWILYNIPAGETELETIVPVAKKLDNGAIHGKNDFGKYGYGGPCPPKGETHRYFFRIFALKKKLAPESAGNHDDFYEAIKNNVLEKAEYMGTYKH